MAGRNQRNPTEAAAMRRLKSEGRQYLATFMMGVATASATDVFSATWLSVVPVLLIECCIWMYGLSWLRKHPVRRAILQTFSAFMVVVVTMTVFTYADKYPFVLGSKRLRGLVSGIRVPPSDFSWATNGSVVATPMESKGPMMRIAMAVRSDKPWADAGWGMDLLRWSFRQFGVTYDPDTRSKKAISFYIRGETGGESIGISMKSDRQEPDPCGAASDEEKVPLSSVGVSVSREWKPVRLSFDQFPNVAPQRLRNIAFYTNGALMGPDRRSQTVYLKRIRFLDR